MLFRMLSAAAVVATLVSAASVHAQTLFRPIAVVNDSAITGFDLAQRAQILSALGVSAASTDALRNQALDQLIEDRLKLQAGRRIGIKPSPEVVAQGIEQFAQRSGLSSAELQAMLNAQGVTDQAIEDLAASEIIWLQVVRARFADRVEPGAAEIDAELALLGQQGAFEYRIREIGLPGTGQNRTEAETRALAQELYNSLNNGGSFSEAVARYSESPSAPRNGELGWISTELMPPNLLNALRNLQPGGVSAPLSVAGGLTLIKLDERRATGATGEADPEARERVRRRLINVQSARLADGLLQEMRRDALIEVR